MLLRLASGPTLLTGIPHLMGPSHRARNVSRWLQAAHEHRGERPGIAGVRTVSGLTQQPLHWPGVSSVIDIPDEQPWHRVRQPCGIAKRRHDANGVTGLVMGGLISDS
jgi:hypothetical protein